MEMHMHDSVRRAFISFAARFDGRVGWMYLDILGLVTTAVAISIDPIEMAIDLPFVHKSDGRPASADEIHAEWLTIKAESSLVELGCMACRERTSLCLSDSEIDSLAMARLIQNERILRYHFVVWDHWPADAQLGMLSLAWVLGGDFAGVLPKFTAACLDEDWRAAASNCALREWGEPRTNLRNEANAGLFRSAALAAEARLNPGILLGPEESGWLPPIGSGIFANFRGGCS
jgi:hypothetical protein